MIFALVVRPSRVARGKTESQRLKLSTQFLNQQKPNRSLISTNCRCNTAHFSFTSIQRKGSSFFGLPFHWQDTEMPLPRQLLKSHRGTPTRKRLDNLQALTPLSISPPLKQNIKLGSIPFQKSDFLSNLASLQTSLSHACKLIDTICLCRAQSHQEISYRAILVYS